jgi:PST family polysaccharide transporter
MRRLHTIFQYVGNGSGSKNFFWLIVDRLLRFTLGLTIGGWSARYLGKENFGALNYAQALAAIVIAISPLGMEAMALREVVKMPNSAGRWIGTVLGFRLTGSFLGSLIIYIMASHFRPDNPDIAILVLLLCLGLVFQSFESGELLFQSRTQIVRLVIPRMAIAVSLSFLKILVILTGKSVLYFACLVALEQILSGLFTQYLLQQYLTKGDNIQFCWVTGRQLLNQSWPLAIASIAVITYVKTGQLMLGNLLGDAALGIYSAGVRIPEALYFVPVVLGTSMLPALLRAQMVDGQTYERAVLRYLRLNILIAFGMVIPLALSSWAIVRILFGLNYISAAPVLVINALSLIFVFSGVARSQILLNARKTSYAMFFSVIGLAVNVGLNLWLIPRHGAVGAAISTMLSYALSGFVATFWFRGTRSIGRLQVVALFSAWKVLRPDTYRKETTQV